MRRVGMPFAADKVLAREYRIIMKFKMLFAAAGLIVGTAVGVPSVKLADQVPDGRPEARWRGFNLLEMFIMGKDRKPKEFREEDFQIIHDWGFNFVRLPMDYRYWIKDGDWKNWEEFNEEHLQYIDRAIQLGRKYGVHICLNMHRCPGYTVARPKEPRDLFTDAEAQRVCAKHWAMFARRYRGIPSRELSFNLLNEPPNVGDEVYGAVAKKLIAAIRAEDPERLIIADGIGYGRGPVASLLGMRGVGQATRGYSPMSVSHYLASWVGTPSVPPVWPISPDAPSGVIGGMGKRKLGMNVPFVVRDLPACKLVFRYGRVSGRVTLEFVADGQVVHVFNAVPALNDPKWGDARQYPQWGNLIQAAYLGTSEISLPTGAREFTVRIKSGDWLTLGSMKVVAADGRSAELPFDGTWGAPQNFDQHFMGFDRGFLRTGFENVKPKHADAGREYLERKVIGKWDDAIAAGDFCFCGECGMWKKTPHRIVLDIMEDYLVLWKERNMGWALWNLRGGFGVLDSDRADVEYEDFRGHKLDRKLLELLQKY